MTVATVSQLEQIINQDALIRKLDISEYEGNKRFIAGYANIAGIRDSQGEVVTQEALKAAWDKWKQNPDFCILSLAHSNLPMAKVVFEPVTDSDGKPHRSGVDERGLYIVAQVRDDVTIADELWSDIEMGKQRGYSIGGRNLDPQSPECKDDVCTRLITSLELYEVAIVDQPANKWSIFNVLKQEDLAKLAEDTKHLKEQILMEGAVKISKTPCPKGKHYHVLVKEGVDVGELFNGELFAMITEPVEGEDYVNLFDTALLRPHGALTGEARHGGVNPPPLTAETPDTLKTEGENPLKEETIEEVIEEKTEESPKDDSSETAETVEEVAEEALAPITIETLAADLALVIERLEGLEKRMGSDEVEKSAEEAPEKQPEVKSAEESKVDEVVQIVQENVEAETPVKTEATEVKLEEAKTLPQPTVEPEPEAEPPKEEKIETRGVATQTKEEQAGFDIAAVRRLSWKEIHEAMEEN